MASILAGLKAIRFSIHNLRIMFLAAFIEINAVFFILMELSQNGGNDHLFAVHCMLLAVFAGN